MNPGENPWPSSGDGTPPWQQPAQPEWQAPGQPVGQSTAVGGSSRSSTWLNAGSAIAVLLLVTAMGVLGWRLGVPARQAAEQPSLTVPQQTTTQASAPSSEPAPAPRSYTTGAPGNGVTSPEFSQAVFGAFYESYSAGGNPNVTVNAYSPVTHITYTMTCRETGSTVTCTGGNNAVVVIS
ncbi:hypothetical protein [Corynebacterium doosanense]|uniref:hypothetical protein n=1 Tax=Corynebacterium doosanense TaxID=1121358 RepID=UPI00068536F4|nr:hypothetical protein [Corynebacterium doosanense]